MPKKKNVSIKRKRLIDPETDNEVELYIVRMWGDGRPKDKGFVKIFDALLESVIYDSEVVGKPLRLLLYMIKRLDWNQKFIYVDREEACRELNIGRSTYYLWIKILVQKGLIIKKSHDVFELNPKYVVRGYIEKGEP